MGWVGSESLKDALSDAPCGCDLEETAATMTDTRGADVLRADAAIYRAAWRCPRAKGGTIDPDALDDVHRAAITRVCALTGCDDTDVRTCPGHYARTPQAHEVVRLLRWQRAGQLQMRMPHPLGTVVDALDEAAQAVSAREADEIARIRRTQKTGATGG